MVAVGTFDAGLEGIMRIRLLQSILFAALAGTGCAGTGQVGYGATATVSTPELVYVSPGVQVIADYDEPVFYSDNYYWRYNSGVWYRSPYHTRGWVRWSDVPVAVRRIDRPTAYIHYRGPDRTVVRDHRQDNDERRREQERQQLIQQRERERTQDRRELVEKRDDQRQEDRQKLIDQRERQRQVDRQRLIDQRAREQRERERRR